MFGPKIRNVFKTRWNAVFWSLSVLLTAYCTVPSPEESNPAPKEQDAADRLLQTLAPGHAQPHHHANPWAKAPAKAGAKPGES